MSESSKAGSQTQIDCEAAWDSKKDLAGCIEKVKSTQTLNFQSNIEKLA